MQSLGLGLVAACAASTLYDLAVALQALEARAVPAEHSLRPSLLVRLARRPRWLGATALGVLGWPLQVVALLFAPLTVVQPALALGLLLLLVLGVRMLGEPVGPREVLATLAIVGGVAGIAWAAPEHTASHAGVDRLAPALGILAAFALAPYFVGGRGNAKSLLVVAGAGCAYAWTGLSSKVIADEIASGAWLPVVAWAGATGLAAGLGLLSEMTALQRRPATQVAPIVFVVQMVVPVLLAPLLGSESWGSTPLGGAALALFLGSVAVGTAVLGRSPAVAAFVAAGANQRADRDGSQPEAAQLGQG